MLKTIIFDFDGVLADSFDSLFQLIKAAMNSIGLALTPDQYRHFFMENVHQGFKNYIDAQEKYKEFSQFRKANFDQYYQPRLFPGVFKTLKELSKKYFLAVASSGHQNSIVNLLKKANLDGLFELILADTAYSKINMLKDILHKSKTKAEKTIMITDTVGDIIVAKKLGLKTMAVTWGFQTKKTLASAKPNFIADSFGEMAKLLKI